MFTINCVTSFSPAQTPSQANSVNASLRVRLIIVAKQHRTMTHYAIAGEVVRLLPIPSAFVASLANEEDLGHPSIHQLPVRPGWITRPLRLSWLIGALETEGEHTGTKHNDGNDDGNERDERNGAKPILPEAKPHGLRWKRNGRRERREMDERTEAKPILPEAKPHG